MAVVLIIRAPFLMYSTEAFCNFETVDRGRQCTRC